MKYWMPLNFLGGLVILGMISICGASAFAGVSKTVRATDLSPALWKQLDKGQISQITVEFRKGDEIPLSLEASGDFFQTVDPATSVVTIKRDFWVRLETNHLQLSLDGITYKPLHDLVSGTLTAEASGEDSTSTPSGVASAIRIGLKAVLK